MENPEKSVSVEKTDNTDKADMTDMADITDKTHKDDSAGRIDMKLLVQSAFQGVILAVTMILVALLIELVSAYWFVDILFFEGVIALLSGLVFITGGIPLGSSLKGLGRTNPQADATLKIEILKKEEEIRQKKLQSSGKTRKIMLSILFAGAICTIIDIILVSL